MLRIGHGFDVHRFAEGRRCILGGVDVPSQRGLLGHSDADVVTHALMDAILGALRAGDIGQLFPDDDPAFEGADSLVLLSRVKATTTERLGFVGREEGIAAWAVVLLDDGQGDGPGAGRCND